MEYVTGSKHKVISAVRRAEQTGGTASESNYFDLRPSS